MPNNELMGEGVFEKRYKEFEKEYGEFKKKSTYTTFTGFKNALISIVEMCQKPNMDSYFDYDEPLIRR